MRRTIIAALCFFFSILAAAAPADTVRFIFIPDLHVESDFMERGKPRYVQWKPGNHAAIERTFRFINEDPSCKGVQFILFGGDQLNTGYTCKQDDLDAEMVNYRRLVGTLDIGRDRTGLEAFKFAAPDHYLCRENLHHDQDPIQFSSPGSTSRIIAIQGNHDTGVPEFYRDCAFQCGGVRFICFFAAYCGLPAPPGGYRSTGMIYDETFGFVKEQMEAAAADREIDRIVLVCHWGISGDVENFVNPIVDACPSNGMNDNRAKLLALCEKYGCSLFINGHEHNERYPVAMFGCTPDINCGSAVGGSWSVVTLTEDKAVFDIMSMASAVEDVDGNVRFTSLPGLLKTVEIPLAPHADRSSSAPRDILVRLNVTDVAATEAALDYIVGTGYHVVVNRCASPSDPPEMKALLAKAEWKGNVLATEVDVPDYVEVVDLYPGEERALFEQAAKEGWRIRSMASWWKRDKENKRTYGYRTYYVSNDGDDSADGLSPETAWRTLDKVNSFNPGYGDKILFKAGDVFRGRLIPASGRPSGIITYGSWGGGEGVDKPVIEPSWDASRPEDWERVGRRLWRFSCDTGTELANVIFDHGASGCAFKEDRLDQLGGRDLHFTWVREERAVYMVSKANPATRFSSIEIAEKVHVIDEGGCHDICYEGLWLRYGGAHGIGGGSVKRITIRDCDVSWIGGSTLYIDRTGSSVRYGNGIELWGNASDVLIEGCRIWECWDAGITHQSNESGTVQRNITIRGNEIRNCEYSYEYWQQGDGSMTENIRFEDNLCRDAGGGWAHLRRWNPNAAHLMFYDNTAVVKGFHITGNRFLGTEDCCLRLFNAWYPSMAVSGNVWDPGRGDLCRYHGRPTCGLVFKYPDHLDQMRDDNEGEIQGQTEENPERFGHGDDELGRFTERFGFEIH